MLFALACVDTKFLNLARNRIAANAEQLCRFNATATGMGLGAQDQ